MILQGQQFPYVEIEPSIGAASALPYIPLTLAYRQNIVSVSGLLDTGAALNVLPYDIGLQLGAVWEQQTTSVQLTGNLADSDARAIILTGTVGRFPPIRLAFAWSRNTEVPIILGQVNFFMEFDVCFFRSKSFIEMKPNQRER